MKQDKDVSRYDMVLAQSLDGIRARAKWIERSTAELKQWLENWKKEKGVLRHRPILDGTSPSDYP